MACCQPLKIKNPHFYTKKDCYHSINSFKEYIDIPCGWCLNCRVDKRNWLENACNYEFKKYGCGAFVTLTYDDINIIENLVVDSQNKICATLKKEHFTRFMYSLRTFLNYHKLYNDKLKIYKNFKYVVVGEYGEHGQKFDRPHIHILFFGLDYKVIKPIIQRIWKKGFIKSLPIYNGGIRYVLKYMDKQLHGKQLVQKYDENNLERPFTSHSISLGSGLIFDNLKEIVENNYCYKGKHNKLYPIPQYLKRKLLAPHIDHTKEMDNNIFHLYHKQKENIPLPKNRYYSLHTINEQKKKLAILRNEKLKYSLLSDGIPVPQFNYDFDNIKCIDTYIIAQKALIATVPF